VEHYFINFLLLTSETSPCCSVARPLVAAASFRNYTSIKWKQPKYPNGQITHFTVFRVRSSFFTDPLPVYFDTIDNITIPVNQTTPNFIYDPTTSYFIYQDNSSKIFAYYSYKIRISNSAGSLETNWSTPFLNLQNQMAPTPPLDPKTTHVHSTGFTLSFKEPRQFNSILDYYTISILPLIPYTSPSLSNNQQIVLKAQNKFQTPNSSTEFIQVKISGLAAFKSYTITVRATNQAGHSSQDSEKIIANTLEASPSILRPLIFESRVKYLNGRVLNSILFRFEDPEVPNGAIVAFILYQRNTTELEYSPVYTGLKREFELTDLLPFSQYYFQYEVCTFNGCTRDRRISKVMTLENAPQGQEVPEVTKYQSKLNCFKVLWTEPNQANGLLIYFEIFRVQIVELPGSAEVLVANVSAEVDNTFGYSFIDCELKPNAKYKYRVVCGNGAGQVTSEYSRVLVSSQLLPTGFTPLKVEQIQNEVVELRWQKPQMINGDFISYSLFRDLVGIKNITTLDELDLIFLDHFRLDIKHIKLLKFNSTNFTLK